MADKLIQQCPKILELSKQQRANSFCGVPLNVMAIVIETLAAVCLLQVISTLFMAAMARSLGAAISEVCMGYGPTIASIGRFKLRLVPIAGSVKLSTIERAQTCEDLVKAFEFQPRWKRVALHLCGPAILIVFALLFQGDDGFDAFRRGFAQILVGAMRPFSSAQAYLGDYAAYAESHRAIDDLALIAAKLAALNLLPIIPFSAGVAILVLTDRREGPSSPMTLPIWMIIPPVIIWGGWALAFGCAAWRAAW